MKYTRADKIENPDKPDIHIYLGKAVDRKTKKDVDVSHCGWIGIPQDRYVMDKSSATCKSCLKRAR